jgi:hypothetical protein
MLVVLVVDHGKLGVVVDQQHPVLDGQPTSGPLPDFPLMEPTRATIDFLLPLYADSWATWRGDFGAEATDISGGVERHEVVDWLTTEGEMR